MQADAAVPVAIKRERAPERRRPSLVAGAFAGLAGLSAYVYFRNPLETTVFPPCPFHTITGGYCPGCGATRASFLIMKGDISEALHYNALWVIALPFVLWYLVTWAARNFFGYDLPRIRSRPRTGLIILGVLLAFVVLRNLPFNFADALNPPGGEA